MNSFFEKEFTFDRICRIFFTSLLVTAIALLAYRIRDALIPFIVGWIIAAALMPIVRFFQIKLRIRIRILSIFAALIAIVTFLVLFFWLVIPPMVNEFQKTGELLDKYELRIQSDHLIPVQVRDYIARVTDMERYDGKFDLQEAYIQLKKIVPKLTAIVTHALKKIFSLFHLVFTFLYAFFIMIYYEKLNAGFFTLLPQQIRQPVHKLLHDVAYCTHRYFKGQSMIAGIVGIMFSIGFLIIGLPLAIPLGLFIGLLNMIPYAQCIGILPTILLCLLHSADTGVPFWRLFAFCMGVFIVTQLTEDTFLTPKIMGKVTGLNPAIILLSLSIGGSLFGMVGIIMSLPLAPLLLAYYHMYVLKDSPLNEPIERGEK